MGEIKVTCAVLFTLIPLIILISLLVQVVIPNYHGSRFKIGRCQLTTKSINLNEVPWKECSCGVTCTSQFPCVTFSGTYSPFGKHTNSTRSGTFHTDYDALKKNCFVIPNCKSEPTLNQIAVTKHIRKFYWRSTSSTHFHCWALGDNFLTGNDYSSKRASLALFLPLVFFIIGIIFLLASSKKIRGLCDTCCHVVMRRCCHVVGTCFGRCCDSCKGLADQEDGMFRSRVSDIRNPLPPGHPASFPGQTAPSNQSPSIYIEDEAPPPYSAQ